MAHHAMDIAGSSGAAQAMISSMLHAGHESCSANCESCSGDVAREAASKLDSPILRMWSVMAVAADIVPAGYRPTSQATWKMNIMMLSKFADESFMGVVKRLTKRAHRMTAPPLHAMLSTPPLRADLRPRAHGRQRNVWHVVAAMFNMPTPRGVCSRRCLPLQ